ncbi:NAD(P)/FAD-dependent oxidoreductase [Actinopolymorpha alba]|uniref:NAD(P)/FAD-dependent oxidoreductase n=1 Tax=Actinopolymorpha alba TaxID=533267 RepID=UPI000381EB57|nr:FAD-dependent oxidoreductase [Actinopolymorpha alba]
MGTINRAVVVGGSLAGLRAAQTLRQEGFAGDLTVVSAESHLPYNRPPLSKSVLNGDDDVALPGAGEVDCRWIRGRRAVRLATGAGPSAGTGTVVLDDGTPLSFDGLVIATGARPRRFPAEQAPLEGVHVLRTIEDALALRASLDAGPDHVVVIGGGFVGGEVASTAREKGLAVTLIDAAPLPMVRALSAHAAGWLARHHKENGVELISGVRVTALEGERRVSGVRLDDGRLIPASLVVAGLGVVPNTEWLDGSGIRVEGGVVTTATLFASGLPNVVAAGDVVRWPHELFGGELVRGEHWAIANDQAALAARNLLRGPAEAEPFTDVPSFSTYVHRARVQSAGLPHLADETRIVARSESDGSLAVALARAGVLVGAATINGHKYLMRLRRAIAARTPVSEVVL